MTSVTRVFYYHKQQEPFLPDTVPTCVEPSLYHPVSPGPIISQRFDRLLYIETGQSLTVGRGVCLLFMELC